MILTNRNDYSAPRERESLAKLLSHIVQGCSEPDLPYKPNQHDDMFWTLDSANNWKVKFHADRPNCFEIIFRYQCAANQHEEALAAWLKVRISAKPVDAVAMPANAMQQALQAIYDLTEGYADGAPDASARDHLANEVSALAAPWRRVG